MTRSSGLAAAVSCALLACAGDVRDSPPRATSVVPSVGYQVVETAIVIRGSGFLVEPYQDANGQPRIDSTFRAWLDATELTDVQWVSVNELRARVPAGVPVGPHRLEIVDPRGAGGALLGAFAVVAGMPPTLEASAAVVPEVASVGQPVTLRIAVRNGGDVMAADVAPAISVTGDALVLPDLPAPVDVAPGETHVFRIICTAVAVGTAAVEVGAAGTDPVTGEPVRAASVSAGTLLVEPPSLLTAEVSAAPAQASVGQVVVVGVTYVNASGVAPVVGLAPAFTGTLGDGAIALVASPPPCDVASGGTCLATFLFEATAPGVVVVHVDAAGVDANSGQPIAAPRAAATLRVQRAPALSGVLTADPARVNVGQPITITLAVTNTGEVEAADVFATVLAAPVSAERQGPFPPSQGVPAGATRTFTWTFVGHESGMGAFAAAASGEDANGAGPVTLAGVLSNEVWVDSPANLVAVAAAAPPKVSAGQPVSILLDVTNLGEAAADVSPSLGATATGSADWSASAAPAAARVGGGATVRFAWTVATSGSGTIAFVPRVDGVDANSGAPVSASAAAPVPVQAPAHLSVALAAPPVVNAGQTFEVAVDVTDAGEAAAAEVSAAVTPSGPATHASGPLPPPPVRLAGGATQRFLWAYVAGAAPGVVALDAGATATDENAGSALSAAAPQRTVTVQRPAALETVLASAPDRVNAGQGFAVRVRVSNSGDSGALGVAPSVSCDACTAGAPPAPVDVAAGASAEWDLSFTAGAPGTWALRASASGTDATDGAVRSSAQVERPLAIEQPAALAAAFRDPGVAPMAGFIVELEVTNPIADPAHGQAAAIGVAPGPLAVVAEASHLDPAQVSCLPRSTGAATVAAGGLAVFSWTCTAAAVGQVKLSVSAAGSDANDGAALAAAAVGVLQLDEAARILDDPFGDGTAFSFVFGYDGHVFLGPSGDGRGVVRCLPDGTGCASFAFSFNRDTTGSATQPDLLTSVSENTECAALTTIGAAPYCDPVSPQNTPCLCGPDYEVGRGVMGSFGLGTPPGEWLVAMGRMVKSGNRDLNYLYMTRDVASPLTFSYVDMYAAMPRSANIENVASMAVLNDRLYVGVQVDGAERPRMVVLTRTPTPPGLDCTSSDAFATTFQQTAMGETGTGISQVDAMIGFEGRLFVANRRAVLASKTGSPTGAANASTQFDDCTPSPPEGTWEATSIVKYIGKIDITPADKGVTGLVAWQGRLYLARNTRPAPPGTGPPVPELWVFTPRRDPGTGDLLGCLPTDWRRVGTNFGDSGNTHLTALFASASYLYVGYDDAVSGVKVFRTSASAPVGEADFRGRNACTAPCEPVGRAGFGDASNTRLFDARAMQFGGADQVWATLGSGTGGVRVYRVSE